MTQKSVQSHAGHDILSIGVSILCAATIYATPARAAGTVRLELVGEPLVSAMAFQEWAQLLGQAGIRNVRFRTAEAPDQPGIQTRGTSENPVYLVTGRVRSRDELLLPGGHFGRGDVSRLAQWLSELAKDGPNPRKETKGVFGLTEAQFSRLRAELAEPVGFSTQGVARFQVAGDIAGRMKVPVELGGMAAAIGEDRLAEELSELSRGTALAYVLRLAGYTLLPRTAGGELICGVVKARTDLETWPVGWPSEKTPAETLPALFEFLTVNVQNVSTATAIEAIASRLKTPILIDHFAIARQGIDPSKVMVSLPRVRTTHSLALQKLLAPARLKFDVRLDEAGIPFLWVTTIKPE
jgi:hypothetical protein